MTAASDPRARAAEQLLRQLGVAFSTYRLYPGDLSQSTFVTAVERLGEVAEASLAGGDIELGVGPARFHLDELAIDDDRANRLAAALFQRRVQYLRLRRPPTPAELDALFGTLIRDPAEVADAGGVHALLDARGVVALITRERAPAPTSGEINLEHDLAVDVPEELLHEDPDADLPPLDPVPGETAHALYDRLAAVNASLSDDVSGRSHFFRTAAELADGLAEPERSSFGALVLTRAGGDAFAERFVGHLTDTSLARLITTVAAARGENPVDIAARVVAVTGREEALVPFVESLARDSTAGVFTPVGGGRRPNGGTGAPVREGQRLRHGFPDSPEDGRELVLTSLRDYLLGGPLTQQCEQVMFAATGQLRADVRSRSPGKVRGLVGVLEGVEPHVRAEVRQLVETPRRAALIPEVLDDLVVAGASEESTLAADVLEPFGPLAVDALVAALAEQSRGSVRGVLVTLLASVASDDPSTLARYLDDPRWFVVRNIATTLRRIGGPHVVPLLERLAVHSHEQVRREAFHGLAGFTPELAVPALARIVRALDHRDDREQCLRLLAHFRHPLAVNALTELGGRGKPRLPWALRRQARELARAGRGG